MTWNMEWVWKKQNSPYKGLTVYLIYQMWCICVPCTSYPFLFSISPMKTHSHLISDIKRVLLKKLWQRKGKRFFTISLLSSNRNNRLDQSTTWREGRASSPNTKVQFVVVRSWVNQKNVIIDNNNNEYRIRDKLKNLFRRKILAVSS